MLGWEWSQNNIYRILPIDPTLITRVNFAVHFLFHSDKKQTIYRQLSTCGHVAKKDTPIIGTAAKSQAKNKLLKFDWNKLPLLWTLANKDTNSRSLQSPL